MVQFFYFDRLNQAQRQGALFAASIFMLLESLVLFFIADHRTAAYVIGLFAVALGSWIKARNSFENIRLPPFPDLLLYVMILSDSALLVYATPTSEMSAGAIVPRLDIEILGVAVFFTVAAIVFPSCNDISIKNRLRRVDYLTVVRFGVRRCISSMAGLLILGAVGWILLLSSRRLETSALVVLGLGLLVPCTFEHLYGYRSYTMRIFGFSLFLGAAIAILLRTSWTPLIPLASLWVAIPVGVGVFLQAFAQFVRETDPSVLAREQFFWHGWYLAILGIGHAIVFAYWLRLF